MSEPDQVNDAAEGSKPDVPEPRCARCSGTFGHGDGMLLIRVDVPGPVEGGPLVKSDEIIHRRCAVAGLQVVMLGQIKNRDGAHGLKDRLNDQREQLKLKQGRRRARRIKR